MEEHYYIFAFFVFIIIIALIVVFRPSGSIGQFAVVSIKLNYPQRTTWTITLHNMGDAVDINIPEAGVFGYRRHIEAGQVFSFTVPHRYSEITIQYHGKTQTIRLEE